jgi:hypothetical protein
MKSLGLYLFIFGLGSLILSLFNLEFRLLAWMDSWGVANGYIIRFCLIALGIFLMASTRQKPPVEQFPELKEIEEIEKEMTSGGNADLPTTEAK